MNNQSSRPLGEARLEEAAIIKVGFCSSPLQSGHAGRGIGVYTQNLLEGLKKDARVEITEFSDPKDLKDVDLIHYPFFDLFSHTLKVNSVPTVVTIHDVIPLLFPSDYPTGFKGKLNLFRQKRELRKVLAVITDSECSKKDIHKMLGVPLQKIFVTTLAPASDYKKIVDQKLLTLVKQKYQLPDRFVLYTGNVNYNKNIVRQTQAALDAGVDIVLVGKSFEQKSNLDHPELRSFKEFLQKFGTNPKVHILGFVSTEDLVAIYNLAEVFLFATLYEGFGLPVLEAQACGTPVISSNTSSLPEIAHRTTLEVEPTDVGNITQSIHAIMTDGQLRQRLITQGLVNAQRFNWQKTVDATIQVYHNSMQ
jgi:glycosyltransferase involved in cell wall biosynthesis